MRIGSVNMMANEPSGQTAEIQPPDSVSKSIENKISDAEREKRELSSQGELSAEEKRRKRQELQQDISKLNTQLRQRQKEVRREEDREGLSEELRTEDAQAQEAGRKDARTESGEEKNSRQAEPEKTELENIDLKRKDEDEKNSVAQKRMQSLLGADSAAEQAGRRGAVISKLEGGIVILKGEIRQDKIRGADTERKQEELEIRERKLRSAYQMAAGMAQADAQAESAGEIAFTDAKREGGDDALFGTTNFARDGRQAAQDFHLSIGE